MFIYLLHGKKNYKIYPVFAKLVHILVIRSNITLSFVPITGGLGS